MAELEIVNLRELSAALDPDRWWETIERLAPRVLTRLAVGLRAAAPRGRTGKLARGFDLPVERIHRGLERGVQVTVAARVPYGHLVDRGHRIIARGPGRRNLTRSRRAELRRGLKARRAAGPIGFVPGRHFVARVVTAQEADIVADLERLLAVELLR